MVKSYDNNFRRVYKLGCAVGDVCDNPASDTSCCSSDLCNDHFVPPTKTTSLPSPTTPPLSGVVLVGKRQTTDPTCEEALPSACADIVAADPSVCNNDCLATRCPVACGRCKTCYSCDFVHNIQECNSTAICQQGQVCYALETISTYGDRGYRMGCSSEQLCRQISSIPTNTFGKRFTLVGGCCNESSCNKNFTALSTSLTTTPATTTTTTTTLPTTNAPITHDPNCHCPGGDWSFNFHGNCYFINHQSMLTKSQAEAWCGARCGRLPDVINGADLINLENTVFHHVVKRIGPHNHHRAYPYTMFYMDAVTDGSGRGWVWKTIGQPVSHDMLGGALNAPNGSCAYSHGFFKGLLEASSCEIKREALCVLR
nr:uncharacterized protein LOC111101415 isoform X2 [Crassostrea virginica]